MNIQLLSIINCILYYFYNIYSGIILYKEKPKLNKNFLFATIFYISGFYLTLYFFPPFFSIFFTYLVYACFYKIIFEKNLYKSLSGALITYTIRIFFESLFVFIGWELKYTVYIDHIYTLPKFYLNALIVIFSFIIFLFLNKQILNFFDYISRKSNRNYIIFFILYVDVLLIVFFRKQNVTLNFELFADLIIVFLLTAFALINLKQENTLEKLNDFYKTMFDYSKSNEILIKNYRMKLHENKNKLLIIKGMINGNKKELEEYIDTLLNEKQSFDNDWISELKYIPIPGVKNFINYKLTQMKNIGSTIELVISEELENIDFSHPNMRNINDLYTILGVVLDNMIDALKLSNKKLVSLQFYIYDSIIYGEFANTFSEEIDLDKINKLGYTTKDEGHGVGLYLIDTVLKKNKIYGLKTEIIDDFFVQKLSIDLNKKAKNHRKTTVNH